MTRAARRLIRCPGAMALLAALAASACATNPVTGGSNFVLMSEAQEIELGRANDPEIRKQFGVYPDERLQAYVQQVGERLAAHSHRPELVYRFTVLDSPDVNAFALPGGYIYVTRGLLAYLNSEAELAAVLGHEIGHVTARHSVRQYSAATAGQILSSIFIGGQAGQSLFNVIGGALLSGYGREHELEADRLGAEYLARNGYDPQAMLGVLEVLKNQEEFEKARAEAEGREPRIYHGVYATHPSADRRLQEIVAEAGKYKSEAETRVGREAYLGQIDGLVFGDSVRAGVRRNASFYHRELDFALGFPAGWRLDNTAQAVIARAPDGEALIELRADPLDKHVTPESYLARRLGSERLRAAGPVPGAALPSWSGIARLRTPFGRGDARVTVILHHDHAFLLLAAARSEAAFAAHDAAFLATAASFHALREDEKRIAEGLRLQVVHPGPGTTFAGLAERSPLSNYPEMVLRLINDEYPDGEPAPGEAIKIIE